MTGLGLATIGDLISSHALHTTCPSCRQTLKLDLELLARNYGTETTLGALKERLRCAKCGRRIEIAIMLELKPANGQEILDAVARRLSDLRPRYLPGRKTSWGRGSP